MFHPTRGGTRGGADQFSWEDVKTDKDRENYLGNSLMAPVGRWQKGKDLTWYAKEKNSEERRKAQQAELLKLKEAEADAMAVALGVKKKKTIESNVTKEEIKHALNRDDNDSSDNEGEKGLGFGRNSRITLGTGSNSVEIMNKGHDFSSIPAEATYRSSSTNDHNDTYALSKKDKKKKKTKKHKHRHSKKHRHRRDDSDIDSVSDGSDKDDYKRRHHRHASRSVSPPAKRDRSYSRHDDKEIRSRSRSPSHKRSSSSRYKDDRDSRRGASPERRHHRHSKRERSRSRSPRRGRTSSSRYSPSPPPHH